MQHTCTCIYIHWMNMINFECSNELENWKYSMFDNSGKCNYQPNIWHCVYWPLIPLLKYIYNVWSYTCTYSTCKKRQQSYHTTTLTLPYYPTLLPHPATLVLYPATFLPYPATLVHVYLTLHYHTITLLYLLPYYPNTLLPYLATLLPYLATPLRYPSTLPCYLVHVYLTLHYPTTLLPYPATLLPYATLNCWRFFCMYCTCIFKHRNLIMGSPIKLLRGVFGLSCTSSPFSCWDGWSRWNRPEKVSPFLKVKVPSPSFTPSLHIPLYTAPLRERGNGDTWHRVYHLIYGMYNVHVHVT